MSEVKVNKITPRTDCGTTQLGDSGDTVTVTGDLRSDSLKAADGGVIISQSGTTITLGASGDTVSLASGASQSGFGRSGSVDWQTTVKTESFTASSGEGYFIDTDDSGSPFKNYAVTVATGTQYIVGGSGNIFQLDGSTQQAITLMKGKTYRFTQTDDTNDGHPLIISTSNSTTLSTFIAGIVSSGVSYYLDGSSNQSNYVNTTTFNAATTRYIEFQPQTTGTFYFGCYVHGIGMGGAITSQNVTLSLPAGSAGAIVAVADYARNFNTNNFVLSPNGSEKIGGVAVDLTLDVDGQALTLVYIDSTKGWINVQNAEDTETGNPFISATGGTETTSGNCKIHTFTGPGTFTVNATAVCAANNVVSHLIVGAGGGGGEGVGGGGGAGGFREVKSPVTPYTASPLDGYPSSPNRITVTAASFPITVGAGGAGSPGTPVGGAGGVSTFSTITSAGGGGGARCGGTGSGSNGGSGGGGGIFSPHCGGSGNTPPVSPPQGNNGGAGYRPGPGQGEGGGGGGGATAVGGNSETTPNPNNGGDGGAGATTSITASSVGYAGGGGGAGFSGIGGSGGSGGGGCSGPGSPDRGAGGAGTAGTTNTGGGGGAGNYPGPSNVGGNGGSGIVVIRYKFQ